MVKHTIKVFTVFLPDGTVNLQYIHHNEGHPTEDSPGHPLTILSGDKVRWKSMNNAQIKVHFSRSPFVSGDKNLPTNGPKTATVWETVDDVSPAPDGSNPDFKYSVTISGVPTDDPDLVVDLSGGGGAPHAAKEAKHSTKNHAHTKKR